MAQKKRSQVLVLQELLEKEGALAPARAVWIARQCAQGLADLSREGFCHGDLKPANVLMSEFGACKLIDLGFSRKLDHAGQSALLSGTAEYLAPESLACEGSSPLMRDMYSLGVMLYQMLSGKCPFEGETAAEVMRQQREVRPTAIRRIAPLVPRELAAFVEQLLAKQPLRRPQSIQDLVRSLIGFELASFVEEVHVAA